MLEIVFAPAGAKFGGASAGDFGEYEEWIGRSDEDIVAATLQEPPPPPPPPSRTKWTRLVHPSVLTGHVSSAPGAGDVSPRALWRRLAAARARPQGQGGEDAALGVLVAAGHAGAPFSLPGALLIAWAGF